MKKGSNRRGELLERVGLCGSSAAFQFSTLHFFAALGSLSSGHGEFEESLRRACEESALIKNYNKIKSRSSDEALHQIVSEDKKLNFEKV